MVTVEGCVDILLKDSSYDIKFKQYARFLSKAIKEDKFFIGRTPKWRAYLIIKELQLLYYGEKSYLEKLSHLRKKLDVKSPVSNYLLSNNSSYQKFRESMKENYDALKLKEELENSETALGDLK